jgi:hypothetical protein|tara:strand:+ start:377 stop:697 length:321 start_codon:yes stop_codon:yes gene_type:complete
MIQVRDIKVRDVKEIKGIMDYLHKTQPNSNLQVEIKQNATLVTRNSSKDVPADLVTLTLRSEPSQGTTLSWCPLPYPVDTPINILEAYQKAVQEYWAQLTQDGSDN